jgi:four helix bundle protein
MSIDRFEDIECWQLARQLTRRVYGIWNRPEMPRDYALWDQMLRCAGSIMHNIAEGFDAGGNPDFVRFLGYAKRSCTELQSELYVAFDQSYIDQASFDELYEAARLTRAKIGAFMHYLARSENPNQLVIKNALRRRSVPNPEP